MAARFTHRSRRWPPSSLFRRIASVRWVLAVALLPGYSLAQDRPASIEGQVLDAETGRPIAAAIIRLLGTGFLTESDSLGTFRFPRLPPDLVRIEVRRLGYRPTEQSLLLRPGRPSEVTVALAPLARQLPEVVVEESPAALGGMSGFAERRRMGQGTFFDFDDLQSDPRRLLPDLMARVAGVRVTSRGVAISARRDCPLLVIFDGQVLVGSRISLWDLPTLAAYAGIEVYPGPASLPIQFRVLGAECGVLVLWSRRGGERPR